MLSMFKSKKGQIPFLSEVTAWIQSIISWIFAVIPGPIKLIIAIFFVVGVMSAFLPTLFGAVGYHCSPNTGTLHKLPFIDIVGNVRIMGWQSQYEDLLFVNQTESIRTPAEPGTSGCGITNSNINHSITKCSNCTTTGFIYPLQCVTDGYPLEYYNWADTITCLRNLCGPVGFEYYNLTTHKFICTDGSCINQTLTELGDKISAAIIESGDLVETSEEVIITGDTTNLVELRCRNVRNELSALPRLKLFGRLDPFDLRIWILVMILIVVIKAKSMLK